MPQNIFFIILILGKNKISNEKKYSKNKLLEKITSFSLKIFTSF